jgi:hypothetical protein
MRKACLASLLALQAILALGRCRSTVMSRTKYATIVNQPLHYYSSYCVKSLSNSHSRLFRVAKYAEPKEIVVSRPVTLIVLATGVAAQFFSEWNFTKLKITELPSIFHASR